MQITRFYDRLPTRECLQGDTLPIFQIFIDNINSLNECTMQLILEDQKVLGVAKVIKNCTFSAENSCFETQLTSAETSNLNGIYNMHFRLKDSSGLSYRKIAGILIVKRAVQGA